MPRKAIAPDRAGEIRPYPAPLHSYVLFRRRENRIHIRLSIDEAKELAETLNTITRSRIPNPERWRLIANIAHDLDNGLTKF